MFVCRINSLSLSGGTIA